ncbi:energy-coupling factor transporter transmembrane component T [Bacillus licheniformis]|nr:energy-coupling factor transporter transmembrane component T [Bacillus licheniformis]
MMAAFGKGEETIWEWAWFRVTEESVGNGLTIALRMLGFVTYGLLFTSTTDLTQFIMSLIHQCRLSPKWAYGLLAGFRLSRFSVGAFANEGGAQIRAISKKQLEGVYSLCAAVVSQGIRKSERIAVAMEARGFTGTKDRTYYQTAGLSGKDFVYLRVWHQSQRGFAHF